MANKPNQKRNDQILMLHDLDPVQYSFSILARKFKNSKTGKPLSRATVHEIYVREKAKMGDKKARNSGTVKGKYPGLSSY